MTKTDILLLTLIVLFGVLIAIELKNNTAISAIAGYLGASDISITQ